MSTSGIHFHYYSQMDFFMIQKKALSEITKIICLMLKLALPRYFVWGLSLSFEPYCTKIIAIEHVQSE